MLCWLALLLSVFGGHTYAAETPFAATALQSAHYSLWSGDGLPDQRAEWLPTPLPFTLSAAGLMTPDNYPEPAVIWFKLTPEPPQDNTATSLLFWRYNQTLTVFFNGEEIAASSNRPGRYTFGWNRPLLANLSAGQWLPADNKILVKLQVTRLGGNLAPVIVGPRAQLERAHASRHFRQVELNRILLAFAVTIGFFTLCLWLIRRQDTVYLWVSAMCATWAVGTSHMVIQFNPLPFEWWIPLVHIAIDACIFCMYGFIGRLASVHNPRRERWFLGWTLITALVNLNMSAQWFWQSAYLMHSCGTLVLAAMVVRVALVAMRQKKTEAIIITAAILTQIMLFVLNAFHMFFSGAEAWDETLVFAHFGLPLLLLIFTAVLLRRFTDALNTAETLNKDLEQKVEQSRQLIAEGFAERRQLEIKQAAEQERLKIYRDLHDDVGSRLLSIIHADAGNKVGDMARKALESLRQAVSRANTPDQPLSQLLADIREETGLRLQGSGHQVQWLQQDLTEQELPSEAAFHINRIMKELVSNIIRHAQANLVQVHINQQDNSLCVEVSDNGSGFDTSASEHCSGNGLGNIRSRIDELGGSVEVFSNPQGTRTRIVVPLWHR